MTQPVRIHRLGRTPYRKAWTLQRSLQKRLITAKRSGATGAPHVLLLTEHPPVFTLGKSGDAANLLVSNETLAAQGATFVKTDRGGDITFHGPGQLVAYPIFDLDRLHTPEGEPLRDLHRYMRELEEAVLRTCADYGLEAQRVDGRTGVWIGPDRHGPERKICAMGVRCSRWVTMHGLAFNLTTDLSWFDYIVPCGITDRGVTSLEQETRAPVAPCEVTTRLVGHLAQRFQLAPTEATINTGRADHLTRVTENASMAQ